MNQIETEATTKNHSRPLRAKPVLIVLLIIALCAASPWLIPREWNYTLSDKDGCATLFFREPNITIAFEGLSTDGAYTKSFIGVSGFGWGGGGSGEKCSSGIARTEFYWLGSATIKVNDYTIEVKNRGHRIICCGKSFPVQADVPLTLRVDQSGQVHKVSEPSR